jgi:hypothetical protein
MFTRGRRLFTIASFATILVSALHTIGNLNTTPADTGEAAVQHLMRGYTIPLGMGMAPSVWDILRSLVFTMTVTLLALGALGLVLAADRQVGRELRRRDSALRGGCRHNERAAAVARASGAALAPML